LRNCSADVARPCCLVAPLVTDLGRATDLSKPALTRPGPTRALWRKINCRLPSGLHHDEAFLPVPLAAAESPPSQPVVKAI
jgi:hypothetical protein